MDLFFLGQLSFAPLVVEFHRGQWFKKNRRATSRLVVNNAAHATLEIGLERDDITPAPLGDDRFLKIGSDLGRSDQSSQPIEEPIMIDPHFASGTRELGAGIVAHQPSLIKAAINLVNKRVSGLYSPGNVGQQGELVLQTGQHPL